MKVSESHMVQKLGPRGTYHGIMSSLIGITLTHYLIDVMP